MIFVCNSWLCLALYLLGTGFLGCSTIQEVSGILQPGWFGRYDQTTARDSWLFFSGLIMWRGYRPTLMDCSKPTIDLGVGTVWVKWAYDPNVIGRYLKLWLIHNMSTVVWQTYEMAKPTTWTCLASNGNLSRNWKIEPTISMVTTRGYVYIYIYTVPKPLLCTSPKIDVLDSHVGCCFFKHVPCVYGGCLQCSSAGEILDHISGRRCGSNVQVVMDPYKYQLFI